MMTVNLMTITRNGSSIGPRKRPLSIRITLSTQSGQPTFQRNQKKKTQTQATLKIKRKTKIQRKI